MQVFLIRLRSVRDVQDFVSLSTNQPFQVDVSDGSFTANGKSFMEMFCLCLASPLTVTADCGEEALAPYLETIQKFLQF